MPIDQPGPIAYVGPHLDKAVEAELLREDQAQLDAIFAYWSDEHDNTRHDIVAMYRLGSIDIDTAVDGLTALGFATWQAEDILLQGTD